MKWLYIRWKENLGKNLKDERNLSKNVRGEYQ